MNSKLPVIWFESGDSGDQVISFLSTANPSFQDVLEQELMILFNPTIMAAQGHDALRILEESIERYDHAFTLLIDGAIPLASEGLYFRFPTLFKRESTAAEWIKRLAGHAQYIIAVGTCASYGGVTAAAPNLTGSVPLSELISRPIIRVPGCPVNPDWLIGTLAHLRLYGLPELDEEGRPTAFYQDTIHTHCQRRSYFDKKNYASYLGKKECMFSQGCVGPKTKADCPYRLWINHVSYPIKVNTPCIGCTNRDFPDGSTPFFIPLSQKANSGSETKEENSSGKKS